MIPFTIIIPSKLVSNLALCLHSIYSNEDDPHVIVIDDGLTFHPVGPLYLKGQSSPFNFSTNVNLGINHSEPCDVILMNDDALLQTSEGFTKLARVARANPEYGLISSSCNNVGNTRQNPQAPAEPGLRFEQRMVCFVCVYIPRSTINSVGLLDPLFTSYGFQDDDYCLRVRRSGLKLGIFDGCFVDHAQLVSTYRGAAAAPSDLDMGAKIFQMKWGAPHGEI